ncbi:MAG: hypothetical protein O7D30_11755, partial [Rickettsia endosymbiont of Ixodes persulcatus]|nr:hypothetical protein [Rickettsia endosymbiont of Ixodes persulcatus]
MLAEFVFACLQSLFRKHASVHACRIFFFFLTYLLFRITSLRRQPLWDEVVFVFFGACIGSSVVPILAEIHLNTIDKMVYDKIDAMAQSVGFVRRNFDDIIICMFEDGLSESLEKLV